MVRQRQIRLCREGFLYVVVLLAVLIGAVSRQLNLLMLLGCSLLGPLAVSFVYGWLALNRLSVSRKLPGQLHAGQRLRVDVSVTNRRRWFGVWAIRVDDTIQHIGSSDTEGATVGVFFPSVIAGETRLIAYNGQLPRRGRYQFGPLRLSTRFPLGLVQHSRTVDSRQELLVHPQLGRLGRDWAQLMREYEAGSQRMTRRGLLEADFYGLREWRTGDSPRWIHWRTSARQASLVVRQFEQRLSQNLAVLVDLWQPASPNDEQLTHSETAVSFAATLIGEACRRPGARLMIEVAADDWLSRSGPASPVFFREQMDSLALVQPHRSSEFPSALAHALARVPASTPTIVISTRPVDWDAFQHAAVEREITLDGRKLQVIDVADGKLTQFFEIPQEEPA